jgi:hypothetical protein
MHITVIIVLNSIYSITVLAVNESNDLTVTECIGYFGNNCDSPCPESYYGRSCEEPCNCTAEQYCNQYVGCLPRKAVHVTGTMTYTANIVTVHKIFDLVTLNVMFDLHFES